MKTEAQYRLTAMANELKRIKELCIQSKLDSKNTLMVGTSLNALSKELKLFTRYTKRAKV